MTKGMWIALVFAIGFAPLPSHAQKSGASAKLVAALCAGRKPCRLISAKPAGRDGSGRRAHSGRTFARQEPSGQGDHQPAIRLPTLPARVVACRGRSAETIARSLQRRLRCGGDRRGWAGNRRQSPSPRTEWRLLLALGQQQDASAFATSGIGSEQLFRSTHAAPVSS